MISVSQKIQVYPFHSTSRPLPIQKSLEKNKQIYLCIWLDTTHRLAPAGTQKATVDWTICKKKGGHMAECLI